MDIQKTGMFCVVKIAILMLMGDVGGRHMHVMTTAMPTPEIHSALRYPALPNRAVGKLQCFRQVLNRALGNVDVASSPFQQLNLVDARKTAHTRTWKVGFKPGKREVVCTMIVYDKADAQDSCDLIRSAI